MPSIVQFIHPNWEHEFTGNDCFPLMNWNKASHKRKFVKQTGHYVENGELKCDELLFWCEWEAPSVVGKQLIYDFNKLPRNEIINYSGFPKYRHDNLFIENLDKRLWRQNTDPCVFGNQFYYGLCLQSRRKKKSEIRVPTALTKLEKGSIILFGSYKKNNMTKEGLFLVDTIFVVSDWVDYCNKEDLINSKNDLIDPNYHNIFTRLIGSQNFQQRLYLGATYENQIDGMYSFVPSRKNEDNEFGFERPQLVIDSVINNKKNTGFKMSNVSIKNCKETWDEICLQLEELGFIKGVKFDMPQVQS